MNSLRCACYARYSTDRQNPLSIDDQLRKCEAYAKKRGWKVTPECVYSDAEMSGATMNRPGLRDLLAAAQSPTRSFDVILTEEASRLSRKHADVLNICERLNFRGVRICFVAQGIDSSDEKFQFMLHARGMIDEFFLVDTAKRVHRGMEGLVERGLHTGGRCYGYGRQENRDGVRLVIEESKAAVVRRIFTLYAGGHSLKRVTKKLNREGVLSPQPQRGRLERSWSPGAIRTILLNERYTGKLVWNRKRKIRNPETGRRVFRARPESEWVRREAPQLRIVSPELWDRVQERFRFVRTRYGAKTKADGSRARPGLAHEWNAIGSRYLFSGILRCGQCGANMNIVTGAGKRAYSKYGCPSHHFRGTCGNRLTERSDIVEERLLHALQGAVLRDEVVNYTVQKFEAELKAKLDSVSGELEVMRKRKQRLESEIGRLVEGLAAGTDSRHPESVMAAISQREQEIRSITDKLLDAKPESLDAKLKDIRQFVVSRLADLRSLLNADVPTAKAEILQHVDKIDLVPVEVGGERFFMASGEWDLLGGYPSTKSGGAGGRS